MQFDPEESGDERRKRQRDYHAFLDAQVEARKKVPAPEDDVAAARLPVLFSERLKHQSSPPPYSMDPNPMVARHGKLSGGQVPRNLDDGSVAGSRRLDPAGVCQDEYLNTLEKRLEAEVQRRYLIERKMAVLGQKVTCRE